MNKKRKKPKVLFADDDLEIMQSTIAFLEDSGFQLESVGDISSACTSLRSQEYAALVIDCLMPIGKLDSDKGFVSMDAGKELIKMIRSADTDVGGYNVETPILILTAITNIGVLSDLESLEVNEVIQKPVLGVEIVEALERVLALPNNERS
jgi:CheY-like chemotaxis protein